jgi:hypothetical protein
MRGIGVKKNVACEWRVVRRWHQSDGVGASERLSEGERGGIVVFTLAWFLMMTMFLFVIFVVATFGIDLQEGRRQSQVLALFIARALVVAGDPCVNTGNDTAIYNCLVRNTHAQLPNYQTLESALAAPIQFGSYNPTSGLFNPVGNPVNAVFVALNTDVRNLPLKFPQAAIAYFGGGSVTLAPDPRSPISQSGV